MTAIGIAILILFAALVGVGVYWAERPADVAVPAHSTIGGTILGDPAAPATIDIYLDFLCPACKRFETITGPTVDQLAASGRAKVVYHPVAILDRYSPDRYSSRASAASGCAADAGVFRRYVSLLFENQPRENTPGLSQDRLIALGKDAGAGAGFGECVRDARYAPWVVALTDRASENGLQGTPTVAVNGREIAQPTPEGIRGAVAAVEQ